MNYKKNLVSILTPSWNRANYLQRVWEGLNAQTYTNIEWIVADDGSTDETIWIIHELVKISPFPITLIQSNVHIGKPRMDNELIQHTQGEFIIWNDSDDYLLPDAIQKLIDVWCSIPEEQQNEYIGITALCADENGLFQSTLPTKHEVFDTTWNELKEKYQVQGDKTFFVRASEVKKHKFVEVDFMITESSFWNALSELKTKYLPEVVKIMDRQTANRISFSGKMEYCRGKAYGMAIAESQMASYKKSIKQKLWKAITYHRYCIHGEVDIGKARKMWSGDVNYAIFLGLYPAGLLLALKDLLQGKVNKTHREFDVASQIVQITVEQFYPIGSANNPKI